MKFADRLKESTVVTDTTTVDLTGAATGFNSLAKAISSGALAVGDTGICFVVEDTNGNWEEGLYTITSTTKLTRTSVLASSNNNAAVAFPAGPKTAFCTVPASFLSKAVITDDGVLVSALTDAPTTLPNTYITFFVDPATGIAYKATVAALKTAFGSGGGTVDSVNPNPPSNLATSNTTATSTVLTWTAGSDNVAVASYQVSTNGSSFTNVGNVLTYTFTGLTASTTYTLYVQTVDTSGNKSTSATIGVTTSASGVTDTQDPVMSGSVTSSNVTSTGLTMAYPQGSDNVGVVRYDVSVDTGVANWVANGTNLTYSATGLTASTQYTLRVRAVDAAGRMSNVLTGTATTSAAVGAITAANYTVQNPDAAYGEAYTASLGGNPYWGVPLHVKITETANPSKVPAIATGNLKVFWTRVASGAGAPTSLPVAQQFTGGAWPGSVTNASNGGGTGNVPNSVMPLNESGNAQGFPNHFTPDSFVYGGPIAGDYYLVVGFPDGTWKVRPTPVVVSA